MYYGLDEKYEWIYYHTYLASENSGYDVGKRTYDVYNRLTEVKKNNSTLETYTYLPNDLIY